MRRHTPFPFNGGLTAIAMVAVWAACATPALAQDAPLTARDTGALIRAGDMDGAVKLAQETAQAGDAEGQFNLALFYWHGVKMPQNFQEAMRWVTLAAVGGFPKAVPARAMMIKSVEPPVVQKSMEWVRQRLQKEAEAGNNRSLTLMSISYGAEFGYENAIESYFWASLAVANGQQDAAKRRAALVSTLKPADIAKTQDRSVEWFNKFRQKPS